MSQKLQVLIKSYYFRFELETKMNFYFTSFQIIKLKILKKIRKMD